MSYCIYLRKSRADAEAELRGEGETLARHEKALTDFAKYANLEVTAIYREIVSGETIAARPEMQRLLSEVSAGQWDGVIVMDIDRLARGNSIDQGIISQTFLFAGTKIITPAKTYDPANEFDEEYFEFGLFMSRREYKTINRRLQRGRIASVREGKYVGNKTPYGYERVKIQNDKGFTLRIVPDQAAVVRCIFEWYTSGLLMPDGSRRNIGVSLIARELNSRKIPAPSGSVWTSPSVRDMLINPVYTGKVRWNWRQAKKKMIDGKVVQERPRNNAYLLCDGLHEAIIPDTVFQSAANKMQKNKIRPVRGDKKPNNPLASLVICQKCGRRMQRRPNVKTPDLLICAEPTCQNHASYIHLVEKHILIILRQWANGFSITGQNTVLVIPQTEDLSTGLAALQKSEMTVRAQLDKAFEAFETGIYDADTFRSRSGLLKDRLAEICRKSTELQERINKAEENKKIITEFIPKVKRFVDVYETVSDPAIKNHMLKEIIDHIDYNKEVRGHGHEEDFYITVYPRLPAL